MGYGNKTLTQLTGILDQDAFSAHSVTHMLGELDVNIDVRILKAKLSAG